MFVNFSSQFAIILVDSSMLLPVSASDSDLTIKSSDGILFKVHRQNLALHCEAFPGDEIATLDDSEVVELTESSETLELLFQYMYRQRQPDLWKSTIQQLCLVAEAAEKYQLFSAMEICKLSMR
jgi:hypothetical protein